MLNYFCKICSVRLNDYWEDFQNDQIALISCVNCLQQTFDGLEYCISCGLPKSIIKATKEVIPDSSFLDRIHSDEPFFEYESKTAAEKFILGKKYKKLNPNHPKAKTRKIFAFVCFICAVVFMIVFFVLMMTGWD